MRRILFYRTESGFCPVQEFLESLPNRVAQKVVWVLKLVRELDRVPTSYLKKLRDSGDIWEVRADVGNTACRLLGFVEEEELIVLTNAFRKRSQKTPMKEIGVAEQRKADYASRRKHHG
ncbi:MAG: hypothetical protein AUJ92_18900 [Armatimonadetes bacterium CG2_30_59_28]|nr:type II toxin-antitoxin system RelE/ParE family toxin [Armatimonadota bacterium]OIO90381.1 MAG: hypothetical protein AUJ92_18900 [Armatimonadetes bacterium CG2_30_59_28]PIU66344.1 MAG: hypothetical protein COS85_05135 [Armatimonadetes bacterium CG07_land_8_20_14_0_80_59_28]PIY40019.1 MAG: hypothetical protein COZ05_18260 [Armatimonadetes bacterium CG_4_10_14_3_um_filter_59_10]PJB67588.1 MAG: hypothetical protein CO095_12030 [Armatimonadetes bacterium CG_4_9_14_3_um_filter_58_7]